MKPSKYERDALAQIARWRRPPRKLLGKVSRAVGLPFDVASELVARAPGVGWVIERSTLGIIHLGNDVAQWSVRPAAIHRDFQKRGHSHVRASEDVRELDLSAVDRAIGFLSVKYKGLALAEGAASGALGFAGIAPDILALVTLNLRAIGEYATYCGFDVSTQHERLFALNVLGLATSPADSTKAAVMAQLARIAQELAQQRAWEHLQKHGFVRLLQHFAHSLGIELTKRKLAQSLPVAGAAIGGGFNAYYTHKVCEAAYFLYRERFLAAKYGESWTAVATEPSIDAPAFDDVVSNGAQEGPDASVNEVA